MSCNCIPKQKEPHIVKSPQCNVFYVCIPYSFQLPFYSYSVKDFYKTGKKKWYTITKFGIKMVLMNAHIKQNENLENFNCRFKI